MERFESCVAEIRRWMASNMLKLSDDETEYLVIGNRYMLRQVPESILSLKVGNKTITASSSVRNIGVVIDSTLFMVLCIRPLIYYE